MRHSTKLGDLLDLISALNADVETDLDARKQRDRRIGEPLQHLRRQPGRQIRSWLGQVSIAGFERTGAEGAQLYHVMSFALAAFGLLAGWGLARVVLHYTGDAPINIVHSVGLLVLPQIALFLLWLLALMPGRIPLFSGLRSALGFLNPGRLMRQFARLFPSHMQESLAVVWDPARVTVLGPVSRWLVLFWSQVFALWFNIGLLLAMAYLVSFSDLAFVWSTTLEISSERFHQWLSVLARPWQVIAPSAVPARELVDASRYFRLENGLQGGAAPLPAAQLGGWWPFLMAAVACYGLLPRLFSLAVSWRRFHRHLDQALTRLPGSPELLARLNSPLITTVAPAPEVAAGIDATVPEDPQPATRNRLRCPVVAWSNAIADEAAASKALDGLGIELQSLVQAGGNNTTAQDAEVIASICNGKLDGLAVVAKSWEPPLLEFVDFLLLVRGVCNRRQPIIVLLWAGDEAVQRRDYETWQITLRQAGDPDLHIEPIGTLA